MNYCYKKGVKKSVLCWEVVPYSCFTLYNIIKAAVTEAMGEGSRGGDRFELGMSYARLQVTTYKTEERRKVSL